MLALFGRERLVGAVADIGPAAATSRAAHHGPVYEGLYVLLCQPTAPTANYIVLLILDFHGRRDGKV